MPINDSRGYYGAISRLLHWITAWLVTLQLGSVYANKWQPGNALSQLFQPWHTTVGFIILALVGLRIVWLLFQIRNRPHHQGKVVLIGHLSIYALLVAAPVSGLLQGFGIRLFDHLVTKGIDTPFAEASQALHGPLAYLLTALIAGHVFMALFHHWFYRDGTLYRMVGQQKG